MGPLRGDGNLNVIISDYHLFILVEKMGPLRGDGNLLMALNNCTFSSCREDGSPSWGRKLESMSTIKSPLFIVEKMGPLRGDGNLRFCLCTDT